MNVMSNFAKPQPPQQGHGNGYESGRSFSEHPYSFPTYGQTSAQSSVSAASFSESSTLTHLPYQNQPRTPYDDQNGPYLNVGSTTTPIVKEFSPQRGRPGSSMRVNFTTLYDILTSNEPVFYIGFAGQKVQASFSRLDQQGPIGEYTLDVTIPELAGWPSSSVPISMFMESGDGDVIAKVDVGTFVYEDAPQSSGYQDQRKRKYSTDSADLDSSVKRLATQHLRPKDDFSQYSAYAANPSNYMSYPVPPVMQSTSYGLAPQYNKQGVYSTQRNMGPTYPNPVMSSSMRSPSGHWGTTYPSLNSMRTPGVPSNNGASRSLPSPGHSIPTLVRTTCLQQSPSPANTPHGLMPQYNSYPLYPNRAQLEIDGDLDSMTINWTADEWQASRRLVLFTRSQAGSTITTKFKPVTGDEKHPNGLVISCIMWPEKKECFVTSVEIIALLEVLVTGRFTVEEKNRIRRNLEGYRPLTVSKAKDDSANFFKTIMDFPLPKPRNIEKDIKVFYWKDLTVALKKIIGKYSASPSSILPPAPSLLTPISSSNYADVTNSLSYDHQALSPRSISAPSTAYGNGNNMHIRMSPLDQKMPLQSTDMRLSISQMSEPSHWQGNQMPNTQYLGHQNARSWDLTPSYVDNPVTAGNPLLHSQNMGYSNRSMENLDSHDHERRVSISRGQSQQMPH